MADGSALPSWLLFNGSIFIGQPPTDFNGSLDIVVDASDGTLSASQGFTLTINAVNDAPTLSASLADQSFNEDSFVDFVIVADAFSDADGDGLTLTAALSNGETLPEWLFFDGNRFIGTPPDGSSGTIEITVTASDGEFSVSDSFDLTIIEVDQPDESDTPSNGADTLIGTCLLYTSPSPRDGLLPRMPSSA